MNPSVRNLKKGIEIGNTDDVLQFIPGMRLELFIALSQVLAISHGKFEGQLVHVLTGRHAWHVRQVRPKTVKSSICFFNDLHFLFVAWVQSVDVNLSAMARARLM